MGTFAGYYGNMSIPEDKRELFTSQLMKLLNYGGMVSFEKVNMFGHQINLISPVAVKNGKEIHFHYNYFEDDSWETAGYYSDSCRFYSNKIGSNEFCDVISAVYSLYELWDDKCGLPEVNGEVLDTSTYTGWINNVLGTDYSMSSRFKLWDNAEFLVFTRMEDGYDDEELEYSQLMQIIPIELRKTAGGTEFTDLLYIINGTKSLGEEELVEGTYPWDVYNCKKAIEEYLSHNQEDDQAVNKLWDLIKKDKSGRSKVKDKWLKAIAEHTLKLPARVIVYLTCELKDMHFWMEWKKIAGDVYHDEVMCEYASKELREDRLEMINEPIEPVSTTEFLYQGDYFTFWGTPDELKDKPKYYISDAERLYWWDGSDEVKISKGTDKWIKGLVEDYNNIIEAMDEDVDNKDFIKDLIETIADADEYYKRIFPFQTMFYEFIQNSHLKEYNAAVRLFKKVIEDNKKEGAAIEYLKGSWGVASRKITHNPGRINIKRFLGLMANKKLREKYFGF